MVEIFKTNISSEEQAASIVEYLQCNFPGIHFNFDLDDCDRILRAAPSTQKMDIEAIIDTLRTFNLDCEVLE
ncbi:hypothetical protein [Marinoscillum sp. MHG1-6]|uniref:hypothetical protein n=1 Tax=Marinoscillum sp. MHG1-6 TaxID=2959627 RepID=UPI002157BAD2|nr:hypothetical protein [Marinoscillum sp. MHG1-6]